MNNDINDEIGKNLLKKPLIIFKSGEDRYGKDVTLMSNFFDQSIFSLCNYKSSATETTPNDYNELIGVILKQSLEMGEIVEDKKTTIIPPVYGLNDEMKDKLLTGMYKVNKSSQNEIQIINSMNNEIIQPITLKRVINESNVYNCISTLLKMREVYNKLINLQQIKDNQLKPEIANSFINDFLFARDKIIEAESINDFNQRRNTLLEADKYLEKAIEFIILDYNKNKKIILKRIKNSVMRPFIDKFFNRIIADLQFFIQYVGVRYHLLFYIMNTDALRILLDKYKTIMDDFFVGNEQKNKKILADILQNYYKYSYSNKDMWFFLKTRYSEEINLDITNNKNIYFFKFGKENEKKTI